MKKVFSLLFFLSCALSLRAAAPVVTLGGVPAISSISRTGMVVTTLGTGSNQAYRIINASNLYESIRSLTNFAGPGLAYNGGGTAIDFGSPMQNWIIGCDTNLTFSNIRFDAAIFCDFVQTNAGGWTLTIPASCLPFNQTNQAGTLNIVTNNGAHTMVKIWCSGGRTNFSLGGPDHPVFAYVANADYSTNGKVLTIANGGAQWLLARGDVQDVSRYDWLEEFDTTIIGSGSTGSKRWYNNNQNGGNQSATNDLEKPTQHPGIVVLFTATNAGSCSAIMQGDTPAMGYGFLPLSLGVMTNWQVKFLFNMKTSNSVGFYMGFARASGNTNAPTDGMFMRYDCWAPDSTFAHGCVNNSSAVTTNSTGIATTNTWHTWTMQNYGVSNSVVFQLDSSTPWTNTVNIPTNTLTPYIALFNRTHNTNSMVYVDRVSVSCTGLTR